MNNVSILPSQSKLHVLPAIVHTACLKHFLCSWDFWKNSPSLWVGLFCRVQSSCQHTFDCIMSTYEDSLMLCTFVAHLLRRKNMHIREHSLQIFALLCTWLDVNFSFILILCFQPKVQKCCFLMYFLIDNSKWSRFCFQHLWIRCKLLNPSSIFHWEWLQGFFNLLF